MKSHHRLAGLAFASLAAFCGAAHATPMTISLDGLTFGDGGTASGSFTFDPSISGCCSAGSNINIITSTTAGYAGAIFDSSASNPAYAFWNTQNYMSGGNSYSLLEIAAKYFGGAGQDYLVLEFENFVPGQDNLILTQGQGPFGGSYEENLSGGIRYATGAPTVTAAPEPASITLLGASIAGLGWARRKRRRAQVSRL
ncbi:MAG TPA: PEP-CTERM sorting domain-containing protein [Alphaproteobacteria bacterium]|nr:PEP-CTERM sorting domain-containing protein [Alphaproteobacteria bacterium]